MKTGTIILLLITLLICSCHTANRSAEVELSTTKLYPIRLPEGIDLYRRDSSSRYHDQAITFPSDNIKPVHRKRSSAAATYEYIAQSGDTLNSVAARFRVQPQEITSSAPIPQYAFLSPGQHLIIPRPADDIPRAQNLMPDSEVIFSASAAEFDVSAYVDQAGGYLSTHREFMRSSGMTSAADILARVALENSF